MGHKKIMGIIAGLLTSGGLALAQAPAPTPAPPTALPDAGQEIVPYDELVASDWGDPIDGPLDDTYVAPRIWTSAEYLLWWLKPSPFPQAMTTTTTTPPPPTFSTGGFGAPGTVTLIGQQNLNYGAAGGLRLNMGGWFNDNRTIGFLASGFLLERVGGSSAVGSVGVPPLWNPLTEVGVPLGNGAYFLAAPGIPGRSVLSTNARLWGSQINVTTNLIRTNRFTATWLTGFRYLDFAESSTFNNTICFPPPVPAAVSYIDYYGAQNRFYGGQLGARFEYRRGRFFVNNITTVGLGMMHETVAVNGQTVVNGPPGSPLLFPGGTYTFGPAVGRGKQDHFAVVPSVQLNVGMQVTQRLRAYAGYNFLYISDVVRPGEQLDPRVNLVSNNPAVPTNPMATSSFWAHGINLGMEFRY